MKIICKERELRMISGDKDQSKPKMNKGQYMILAITNVYILYQSTQFFFFIVGGVYNKKKKKKRKN